MFNKLRTVAETTRKGYDWYRQNPQTVHNIGKVAYGGANILQREGMAGAFGHSRDIAANFVGNPEVRERAVRIGTEIGGAAVRGALLETGAKKENGKWSVKGVLKSILGLKTGATYVHAAKGAYRGAHVEGAVQWDQHGGALRGAAWDATRDVFAGASGPDRGAGTFNPFTPPAPGQFAPGAYASPPQASSRYEPLYTMPQPGYGRTSATPFDAGYAAANSPFAVPSMNMPRIITSSSTPQGVDTRSHF
ncbi:hypothetical protein [Candidatus Mycosynbacter amalyticus]|nr:hypothetical protein [Candidatus Mycosynbacter amalyticus]